MTEYYTTWDGCQAARQEEDGTWAFLQGSGFNWQEMPYQGEGRPCACQALRQKLLLGTFNDGCPVHSANTVFAIKGINGSYWEWSNDLFKNYDIEIIHGNQEDILRCFDDCVIGCDECCGCGDW